MKSHLRPERLHEVTDFGVSWTVLTDPEGNLFCLVPVG